MAEARSEEVVEGHQGEVLSEEVLSEGVLSVEVHLEEAEEVHQGVARQDGAQEDLETPMGAVEEEQEPEDLLPERNHLCAMVVCSVHTLSERTMTMTSADAEVGTQSCTGQGQRSCQVHRHHASMERASLLRVS